MAVQTYSTDGTYGGVTQMFTTTGPKITNLSTGPTSTNSRPGEQNHLHAAIAIAAVAVVLVIAGVVNVSIGKAG